MKIQQKKYSGIIIIFFLVIVALYNSVYFEKLNVKSKKEGIANSNPIENIEYFWNVARDVMLDLAIDLKAFDTQLAANPEKLIDQYGKSVGITSIFSFLVQSYAKYTPTESGKMSVNISHSRFNYVLRTKFIFGNAARDASGYFKIDEFENTMDFNAVSTELNKLILTRVITKLDSLSAGRTIKFYGALEINSENIPKEIEIIPLKIEAVDE
jgi:hypothetical protein